MCKYIVSRNIPIPTQRQRYPFATMQVGESIFVPHPMGHSAYTAAGQIARRYGMKFTSKQRCERGEMGLRIWRIA